ncbi:alkaline phosphatase family protein [Shimia thalassica]|uniref:alkaline phosphatase family protein n=1 Tax=Shimia thalassica TaxID=1715693 RepID=UPI001C08F36E|nr:alkaline phosphatase family protein [Shimia thalassica]MBU2944189.1 alkaline phosphatase family protein [Shimia thalassica]MDO6503702.1 alkaline phosphatase family protein [Shimia thalassica]
MTEPKTISKLVKWAAVGLSLAIPSVSSAQDKPRLVLQITVDQLRGDLIHRYGTHIAEGGFRYLLDTGVTFTNAHHRHANTETIVGHTTLATGTDPAIHGMVANLWFDRKTGTPFYNVQDPDYPLVGASGIDAENEIDPTQRAATTDGRSPRNIISSTISDEIALHFGPSSKIFGVSVKDRGAIAMAGHAGEAYWFSKAEGRFVTSTFYRDTYPAWVGKWDEKGMVASYADRSWTLLGEAEDYAFGDRDDQPWETEMPVFGRVFPHNWGAADGKYYTTFLTLSPAGDEITVDFAKTLLDAEQLGKDEITDYLSVSLSSTDYVGHIFGPSSLEAEDNFARLDRQIADLLKHVQTAVGLENTLIVLSADHGAPEHPEYLATLGIEAGLFDFSRVDTEPGFVRLQTDFGESADLVQNFSNPYLYLNKDLISERGLDPLAVEQAVAEELQKLPGIAYAIGSSDLRRGSFAKTRISDAVLANFNPDRSGDIYVVFEPHWFVADFDGLHVASAHGSPWTYDTHVPLIFSGSNIAPQTVVRRVETVDVAPTIASLLGTKPPSGAVGVPLPEVMPVTKDKP